jgi:hypothetical protein
MGDKKKKAPELIEGAPVELTDFVDCKATTYSVKNGKLGWVPGGPKLEIKAGAKPGTFEISLSIMGVGVTLPATVSKGGNLNVDTSKLPDLSTFIEGLSPKVIDKWVRDLNDWFRQNGMKLGPPTVKDGVTTLTKVEIPGAAKPEQPKDGGGKAPDPPKTPEPPKTPDPKAPEPKKAGVKAKAGACLGATAIGIGGGLLLSQVAPGNDAAQPAAAGQPTDAVEVTPGETVGGSGTESKEVVRLPDGPVDADLQITGPNSFGTPAQFIQEGNDLTLLIPGNAPFTGPIDDAGKFKVRNPDGSFDGGFTGDKVRARHIFQGQNYTMTGDLANPVVTVTIPGTKTDTQIFVDLMNKSLALGPTPPEATSGDSDPFNLLTGLGLGTLLLGTGLVFVGIGQPLRDCSFIREEVEKRRDRFWQLEYEAREAEAKLKELHQAQMENFESTKEGGPKQYDYPTLERGLKLSHQVADAQKVSDKLGDEADEAADSLLDALQDLATCEGTDPPSKLPDAYRYPGYAPNQMPQLDFQPPKSEPTQDVM